MNILTSTAATRRADERRGELRKIVHLPAFAEHSGSRLPVTLLNLTCTGAMIGTSKTLATGSRATLWCGSIEVQVVVIWEQPDRLYGVRFLRRLSEAQVTEQLSRNGALTRWRQRVGSGPLGDK